MRIVAVVLIAASLGGCVPLVAGAVGYGIANEHRDWCWRHYRNPHCQMPMGVHR